MQIAIVGLAASGKTTVFNTLTRGHAETGGFGGLQLNVGVVKVPDARLDRLAEIFKPKKIVQADVTYVDLPAPPASSEGRIGTEELPAEHLGRLRDSDALLHVVRAFEDPSVPHPLGNVDPWRDLENLDLEFILADLAIADRRLERLAATGRHGTPAEREANEREEVILRRLKAALEAGRPIRDEPLERRRGEGDPRLPVPDPEAGPRPAQPRRDGPPERRRSGSPRSPSATTVPARDRRLAVGPDRDGARRARRRRGLAAFMDELGLHESSLDRVIALSYRLLGLISFLTAGPDEVRAWPIPDDSTAVDAAAAIHTDLAHGFIRAEVVAYEDLLALGSIAEARKHGKLRSEGKTYRVRDGDVLEILFSR